MLTRFSIAVLLIAACATAFGDTLVVPNNQASAPGNMPVVLGSGGALLHVQEVV